MYSVLLIPIDLSHTVKTALLMPILTTSWSGYLENIEYWVMQISKMVWCILLYNIKSTFTHIATSLIKKFSTIQKLSSPQWQIRIFKNSDFPKESSILSASNFCGSFCLKSDKLIVHFFRKIPANSQYQWW